MSGPTDVHALDVVSAAYRIDRDPTRWLKALVDAAHPAFDRGFGVMAWSFRLSEDGSHAFNSPIAATGAITPAIIASCVDHNDSLSPDEVAHGPANSNTLDTASRVVEAATGGSFLDWPKFDGARAFGIADCMVAKGFDPAGYGFVFAAPLPRIERVAPGNTGRWFKAMAHVLAALRLRSEVPSEEGEAVLDPGGRVLHATADARSASAREALRDAAISIDRARAASGRSDPDAALGRWRALAAGRWSLVDRFESDGRRFLIARKNDPAVGGSPVLTERGRQILAYAAMGYSNQNIAYVLGLAPSTVSTHLRRAMRRLGVKSRADLAALLAPPPSSGPPE